MTLDNDVHDIIVSTNYLDGWTQGLGKIETPMFTRLASDAIAGATLATVYPVPKWMTDNLGWVAIGVGSSSCELRKFTRYGSDLTISALSNAHIEGEHAVFLDRPTLIDKWFGAPGDNSTDETTALNNMLIQAGTSGGGAGEAVLTPGIHLVTNKITVPHGVSFKAMTPIGSSGVISNCVIKATTGFAASTPVVFLGSTGTNQHGIKLKHIMVDANDLALYGIYAEALNELCKLEDLKIINATSKGIYMDGTGGYLRNFEMQSIYIYFENPAGTEVGVHIVGGASQSGTYKQQRGCSNITVSGTVAQNIAAGIQLDNCMGAVWDRVHVEECDDGVLLGDGTHADKALTLIGVYGVNCTDVIDIADNSTHNNITIIGAFRSGGTNTINDHLNSKTLTAYNVGLYAHTDAFYINGMGYRQTFDLWFQDNVAASQTAVQLERADHGGADPPDGSTHQLLMGRAGSVTAVWIRTSTARTAGTLTATVYNKGAPTSMTVTIDDDPDQEAISTYPIGQQSFSAFDRLDIRITTDASWLPTTADLRAGLEVVT